MQPCSGWTGQNWVEQTPPLNGATKLLMPALRDVGTACVSLGSADTSGSAAHPADCESDKASLLWVRDGDAIRSSVSNTDCLAVRDTEDYDPFQPSKWAVELQDCNGTKEVPINLQRWAHDASSGALTLIAKPEVGCITLIADCSSPVYDPDGSCFMMMPCEGGWSQAFAFGNTMNPSKMPVGPPLAIMSTGQCSDVPGWFDSQGKDCFYYGMDDYCGSWGFDDYFNRHGHNASTACCVCQEHHHLRVKGKSRTNGADLILDSYKKPQQFQQDVFMETWTWVGHYSGGSIMLSGTTSPSYCVDLRDSTGISSSPSLQLWECDDSRYQTFSYNRSSGSIALLNGTVELCMMPASFAKKSKVLLTECGGSGMRWSIYYPDPAGYYGVGEKVV